MHSGYENVLEWKTYHYQYTCYLFIFQTKLQNNWSDQNYNYHITTIQLKKKNKILETYKVWLKGRYEFVERK